MPTRITLALTLLFSAILALACATEPAPDPSDSIAAQCDRADNELEYGRLEDAERFLVAARQLAQYAKRGTPEHARVEFGFARLRRAQGDVRKARHYLALARFSARAAHGPDSLEMAEVEMESSRQYQLAGRHEQTVAAIEKALEIRRALLAWDDPLVHQALSELAWAHHLALHYPRAVRTYEKVLNAFEWQPGAPIDERVMILNRLAWIHERAALSEKSDAYNAQARAIVQASTPGGGTSARFLELGLDGLPSLEDGKREVMGEMKARALDWIEDRHFHLEHFRFEEQMLITLRRVDRNIPLRKVRGSLVRDLLAEFISFAPAHARSNSRHRYALPFEPGTPRETVRTSEGAHGYDRVYVHAVDFAVPAGSAVLAAREGRVVRVVTGFETRARAENPHDDLRHGLHVNRVIVLHDDDTYATYQPLAPEIEVEEGMRVARGQRLGRTARLEDGETPIVHFDVRRNGASAGSAGVLTPEPVRTQFADVPDQDGVPLAGHRYANESVPASPAPTAD